MKSTSRTISSIKNEIRNKVGDEYSLISSTYKNNHSKLLFIHNTCGNTFDMSLTNFLRGQRCPECAKAKRLKSATKNRKNIQLVKDEICNLTNNEYSVISNKYTNNKEKIEFKHNICGSTFTMKLNNFLNGQRCPECARIEAKKRITKYYRKGIDSIQEKYRKKQKDFEKEINLKGANEYKVISKYESCRKKVKFFHIKCGHTFNMTPNHFLNGQRCPFCKYSYMENFIFKKLSSEFENITRQFSFSDCKNVKPLIFDFFIENKILLEYDGEFHYFPIFSKKELLQQQTNDNIKNDYCQKNKLLLIRIPFWEKKRIDNILESLVSFTSLGY